MNKYIGRMVDIIYLDRSNRTTRRRIQIRSIEDNVIRAYDFDRRAPRIFRLENILAMQPAVATA